MSEDEPTPAPPDKPPAEDALLPGLDGFEFTINKDGSVTFIDFPPELLDIAYALNPDDPLVCERMELIEQAATPEDEG